MLRHSLQFKLSQKLSPQQIQLMKLIQLPTQAFEQRLQEELVENPALENGKEETGDIDDYNDTDDFNDDFDNERIDTQDINIDEYLSNDETPDYKYQANNYSDDDDEKSMPHAAAISFHQDLLNQLNTFILSENEREIAEFLVGSIDDMGYIRRTIQDIVDDLAFTQGLYTDVETVEKILHIVQELEPAGVGARNLQECLFLQLKHKTPSESIDLAIEIINTQFDAFTKKHYEKLLQKFDVSKEQLRKGIEEIEKLNPKPGGSYDGNIRPTEHVVPDFTIKIIEEDELELLLNGRNAPELHEVIKTLVKKATLKKTLFNLSNKN
jgi:RNA polymerase sigma-54 factor